jgi:hypothetical protein
MIVATVITVAFFLPIALNVVANVASIRAYA